MNSVLLIGSNRFTASVAAQVRGLDALSVTRAKTVSAAAVLMEKSLPDVAIAQASQLVESSVLKTFGQDLHNVYFVVIEAAFPGQLSVTPPLNRHSGESEAHRRSSSNPLAGSLSEYGPFYRSDLHLERVAAVLESGADAYCLLPVQSRSVSLAAVTFSQSQQRLIQAYVQIGLARAQRRRALLQVNDWLSAAALVDALTQVGNRRAFDLELPRQIQMARARGAHLSLLLLDIDYFKRVNDRYGHLVGDDVLKRLAQRLLTNMRFYDTPFRYGGEEFVVTLSNTDLSEGQAIADRLRQSIARQPFELTHLIDAQDTTAITVSIGLTELHPSDDAQGRSFFNRADQNLLKAKALGRNQVVSG